MNLVFVLFVVCTVPGEEVPVVCLLGRPGYFVFSRSWHWTAHFPSVPGKNSYTGPLYVCKYMHLYDLNGYKHGLKHISWGLYMWYSQVFP